jgi:hypothetical protein
MRITLFRTFCLSFLSLLLMSSARAADPVAPWHSPGYSSSGTTSGPSSTVQGGSAFTGTTAPSPKGLSVWGILPWGGIGGGARFMTPLAGGPLLTSAAVRDSFALEFGADLLRWSYDFGYGASGSYSWTEVLPVVGVMWNLWFSQKFCLYPKIEAGYAFGWLSGWSAVGGYTPSYGGAFIDGAAGALYSLDSGITLRAEVGIAGLKVGAGWLF